VFPFGSVPLKTYLPDGDIDLTALGLPNAEDALASSVRHVLEMEEQNNEAEFEIKDVQYIHAEVSYFAAVFVFQFITNLLKTSLLRSSYLPSYFCKFFFMN